MVLWMIFLVGGLKVLEFHPKEQYDQVDFAQSFILLANHELQAEKHLNVILSISPFVEMG